MYRVWQITDKSRSFSDNVLDALNNYISKHGLPKQILLETSDQIGETVSLPDGMNIVKKSVRLPKNIIYVGGFYENNETEDLGVEVVRE